MTLLFLLIDSCNLPLVQHSPSSRVSHYIRTSAENVFQAEHQDLKIAFIALPLITRHIRLSLKTLYQSTHVINIRWIRKTILFILNAKYCHLQQYLITSSRRSQECVNDFILSWAPPVLQKGKKRRQRKRSWSTRYQPLVLQPPPIHIWLHAIFCDTNKKRWSS